MPPAGMFHNRSGRDTKEEVRPAHVVPGQGPVSVDPGICSFLKGASYPAEMPDAVVDIAVPCEKNVPGVFIHPGGCGCRPGGENEGKHEEKQKDEEEMLSSHHYTEGVSATA